MIEFAIALIWPCVILFIFISLKSPIRLLLEQLPNMAARASKISFSGVSLEIDHKLNRNNTPELREAMKGLTTPALKELLEVGDKPFRYLTKDWESSYSYAGAIRELQLRSLVDVYESKSNQTYPFEYKATDLGRRAHDILLQSIIDLFISVELSNDLA